MAFYLDVVEKSVRDPSFPSLDWTEIWRTVSRVTPEEWVAYQTELRRNYERILALIKDPSVQPGVDEMEGVVGIIAHTAYHLGEIRQALCTLH